MKVLALLVPASILFVSACSQEKADIDVPVAIAPPHTAHTYQCESGATIVATYPSTSSARVEYQGNSYSMQIAVSASGARYVGGELEWWTKGSGSGSEATLFLHLPDGSSGESVEVCIESIP